MRFGRVEGIVVAITGPDPGPDATPRLRLTVLLESGGRLETIRDEPIPLLRPLTGPADLRWHADQFTQETLGTDLAEQGWEVIAAEETPSPTADGPSRSASYIVRNLQPAPAPPPAEENLPTRTAASGSCAR